jgi:acyl dehydratase
MTMRMLADGILNKSANRGGAGAREVRWMKPVRPGDVLRVEAEVIAVKPSQSKPVGFVTVDCRLFNQTEQVAFLSMTPIIARRG